MPSIRFVSHCYSKELPQYAVFLRAQLSSLLLYPSKLDVYVTICCAKDDPATHAVLDEFKPKFDKRLFRFIMPQERLFRRTIGRNAEALSCDTDLIWYTDVDHLFRQGCIDSLWQEWRKLDEPKPTIVWPHFAQRHINQEIGDKYWKQHVNSTGLIDVDELEFETYRYRKPLGGTHISPKWFAHKYGYLNGDEWFKWMQVQEKAFVCFREDQKYRRFCETIAGGSKWLDIVGMFRLRHTALTHPN